MYTGLCWIFFLTFQGLFNDLMHFVTTTLNITRIVHYRIQWATGSAAQRHRPFGPHIERFTLSWKQPTSSESWLQAHLINNLLWYHMKSRCKTPCTTGLMVYFIQYCLIFNVRVRNDLGRHTVQRCCIKDPINLEGRDITAIILIKIVIHSYSPDSQSAASSHHQNVSVYPHLPILLLSSFCIANSICLFLYLSSYKQ